MKCQSNCHLNLIYDLLENFCLESSLMLIIPLSFPKIMQLFGAYNPFIKRDYKTLCL